MTDEPIFIFGQPRSGTTLLMRILNVSDGVRIYGEHGGSAYYIGLIHKALCGGESEANYHANVSDTDAESVLACGDTWCNNYSAIQTETVKESLKSLLHAVGNPFNKKLRWGFKEVNGVGLELIDFIVSVYPKSRILMVNRNPVDSIRSSKRLGWCVNVEEAVRQWNMRTETFIGATQDYPAQCRTIAYEEINSGSVKSILEWLNIKPAYAHMEALLRRVGAAPATGPGLTEHERRYIADNTDYSENPFEKVYKYGGWDGKGSGPGSDPDYCKGYSAWLIGYIRSNGVGSVVDAGCGDWQFSKDIDWTGIDYTGIDVARSVIDENKRKYSKPGITFVYGDAIKDVAPTADLLIVKDVIHHLKPDDIRLLVGVSRKYRRVLWVVDMGEEVPHGAWPHEDLMTYFSRLKRIFVFEEKPGYPYGKKAVLEAVNSELG